MTCSKYKPVRILELGVSALLVVILVAVGWSYLRHRMLVQQAIKILDSRATESTGLSELVRAGVPVNIAGQSGTTMLMVAAIGHDLDLLRELIGKGANVNAADRDGETAVMYALVDDGPTGTEALKILLDAGADPNVDAREFGNPLVSAAFRREIQNVRLLILYGAHPDALALGRSSIDVVADRFRRYRSYSNFDANDRRTMDQILKLLREHSNAR